MKKNKYNLLFFLLVAIFLFTTCKKDNDIESNGITESDNEILRLVNQHRATLNLPPMEMNKILWQEAYQHTDNMAKGTVCFGHDGFSDRVARVREKLGNGGMAENVAYGYQTPQAVMNGWLNSSGHKANIEGNYNLVGISSIKNSKGTWYYTQLFFKN